MSVPGEDYELTQTEEGYFLQASQGESMERSVDRTNHYLSFGLTSFYIIDKDKSREHSIGLGADYLYSPGTSDQIMADLSYRWSVLWQTSPLQKGEWRLDVGPVFRYELSPPREMAPGLNVRSYFIGIRAGFRFGI